MRAAASFHSGVRAWPSSSMHVHTTAAPYSRARVRTRSNRVPGASPSSRLTELMMALPPYRCRPASITSGSVESSITGAVIALGEPPGQLVHVALPSRPT